MTTFELWMFPGYSKSVECFKLLFSNANSLVSPCSTSNFIYIYKAHVTHTAQLEGTPPPLHLGRCSSVGNGNAVRDRQTDVSRQTDKQTMTDARDQYTFRIVYDSCKCNYWQWQIFTLVTPILLCDTWAAVRVKPPPAAQMHTSRLFRTYSSIFLWIFSEPTHNVRTFKALKNHMLNFRTFQASCNSVFVNSVQYSIVSDNINQATDEFAVTFGTQRCLLTQATLHCTKSNTQPINTTELWCTNHHTVYIDSHDLLLTFQNNWCQQRLKTLNFPNHMYFAFLRVTPMEFH